MIPLHYQNAVGIYILGGDGIKYDAPHQKWSRLAAMHESNEAENVEAQRQNKRGNIN